jgi:hypothetical protein
VPTTHRPLIHLHRRSITPLVVRLTVADIWRPLLAHQRAMLPATLAFPLQERDTMRRIRLLEGGRVLAHLQLFQLTHTQQPMLVPTSCLLGKRNTIRMLLPQASPTKLLLHKVTAATMVAMVSRVTRALQPQVPLDGIHPLPLATDTRLRRPEIPTRPTFLHCRTCLLGNECPIPTHLAARRSLSFGRHLMAGLLPYIFSATTTLWAALVSMGI